MAKKFEVESIFKAVDKVTAPVSRMQNRVGQFTRSMSRGFRKLNRTVKKFESGIKSASMVAVGAATTVGAAFSVVVKTGADFQQALVNAGVKMNANVVRGTAGFKRLEAATRKVGKTTQFTATQAAQASDTLAKAGLDLNQTIAVLPNSVNFAIAAQEDMTEATAISTRTLGAFGLQSKDAAKNAKNLARVNDVLVLGANKATVSIEDLFEAVSNAGPIAQKTGMTIEQTTAIFDTLANNANVGSKAGTALKTMLVNLIKPSNDAQRIFNKLNVTYVDSHKNLRNILDVLADIQKSKAFTGEGVQEQQKDILTIFGRRAFTGVEALLGKAGDVTRETQKQLENAAGTSKRFAEVMRNTFSGKMKILLSAFQEQMIKTFERMDPQLEKAVTQLTKLVNTKGADWAKSLGDALLFVLNNLPAIWKWTKRIIKAFIVFKILTTIMRTFLLVMETLNVIMAMNPFVLVVVGAIALIVAIVELAKHWKGLFKWLKRIGIGIGIFIGLVQVVKNLRIVMLGLNAVMLGNPIGATITAVALLTIGIIELIKHWKIVKKLFTKTTIDASQLKAGWEPIAPFFESMSKRMIKSIEATGDAIRSLGSEMLKLSAKLESLTVKAAKGIGRGFKAFGGDIASGARSVEHFFGFGKNDQDTPTVTPQVVSPQERTAKTIQETRKTSSAEVTIKDDTGRAEVTKGSLGPGLALHTTGNF